MILLTRLNGSTFAVNPDLLERVDTTPDTVLTLIDGTKYVVVEPVEAVIDEVRAYRASIIAAAVAHGAPALHVADSWQDETEDDDVPPAVPLRRRGRP